MVSEKGPDERHSEIPGDEHNEDDDVSDEEYNTLNNQLDQLNGWLDQLEQKNADIHQQLLELLHKSKTTREEFQNMLEKQNNESKRQDEKH